MDICHIIYLAFSGVLCGQYWRWYGFSSGSCPYSWSRCTKLHHLSSANLGTSRGCFFDTRYPGNQVYYFKSLLKPRTL